jgi:L-rhamnose mutarotase
VRRFAQITQLLPEAEEEYVRCHEQVWPSVLAVIGRCSIANYSIFLRNGLLFAYFEYHGEHYEADMRILSASPEMQRWWKITDPMQKPMDDAHTDEKQYGEKWSAMREVFHFEPER